MNTQTLVCINCPRGCTMQVTQDGDTIAVTGNFCRGASSLRTTN